VMWILAKFPINVFTFQQHYFHITSTIVFVILQFKTDAMHQQCSHRRWSGTNGFELL